MLSHKARVWMGLTILAVIVFNYILIGFPLFSLSRSIESKYAAAFVQQAKSGKPFTKSDESYLMDMLRREKALVDKKLLILNCVGASLMIAAASWMVFGLMVRQDRKKQVF